MDRRLHTYGDVVILTEDGLSAFAARVPGMSDADWLQRISDAGAAFFTPADAEGEPLPEAAGWVRVLPAWVTPVAWPDWLRPAE